MMANTKRPVTVDQEAMRKRAVLEQADIEVAPRTPVQLRNPRRGKGKGCVMLRRDGSWVAVWRCRPARGKPIIKAFYAKSKEEAAARLNQFLAEKKGDK